MKKTDVYRKTYRGITIEINHIHETFASWFTYYVILKDKQLSKEDFEKVWLPVKYYEFNNKKRHSYDCNNGLFESRDWHGGVTFYNKVQNPDTKDRYVKIGCDYNHYGDEDGYYSVQSVLNDAENTVNNIHNSFKVKVWCSGCGAFNYENNECQSDYCKNDRKNIKKG